MDRNTSDGVVWKAYRFDWQGNCFGKTWDLTEDAGSRFCWYHGKLPNPNQKLISFGDIFTEMLCPPLRHRDITRMVSGGPFCDYVDGALFLRVNSSGPSLSNFGLRLAARITENTVITMSWIPNLELGVFPGNQNLVRNEHMVIESRLEMNEEEADNPLVITVGSLLIHIVKGHVDYLQDFVTELENELDANEESMERSWENIGARMEIGGGTVQREMWDDRRLAKLHLDLQRLLQVIGSLKFKSRPYICLVLKLLMIFVHVAIQVIAHVEQVFPRIEENFSQKSWWILPDNVNDLRAVVNRLKRLKENVGFIGSRVAAIQAGFDSRQVALDSKQAALDSKQAAQINQKLYYLSILSVILLPLSFITGIFGLSVGGIPWKDHEDGFRNVLLICAVITVVLLACCRLLPVLYRRIKNGSANRNACSV